MANLGSFDFSAFERLRDDLESTLRVSEDFKRDCMIELANRLLAKVVLRTPVDTGELRRGWTIGQVSNSSGGVEIEVFNPVHYAPYVEYGHRTANHRGWVEGRFMLTVSIAELERELPAIMERMMERYLDRFLR